MRNGGAAARGGLQSVGTALELLRLLAEADASLGVTDAARRLGVAPSTAHRLMTTFVRHGFAMRSPADRGYRRGPALIRLHARRPLQLELVVIRDIAHPTLERLRAETGETAHLSILDGLDAVGIDHVVSDRPVVVRHPIGSRVPAHATAVGQALLAYSPEAVEALIAEGLTVLTDATVPHGAALRDLLDGVRRRGYAVNDRQWNPETAGVAAPIVDAHGAALAAIGVSGPAVRLNRRALLDRLGRVARAAAAEVAARMPDPAAHPHR